MDKAIKGLKSQAPSLHEKLSKATVVYMGPEEGPFSCGGCDFFHGPSSCEIVDGQISAGGCCDL